MPAKEIMRIELTGPAKQLLAELSDKTGMTQVAIASRLVEWFARQPDTIQSIPLGRIPDSIAGDFAKLLLATDGQT